MGLEKCGDGGRGWRAGTQVLEFRVNLSADVLLSHVWAFINKRTNKQKTNRDGPGKHAHHDILDRWYMALWRKIISTHSFPESPDVAVSYFPLFCPPPSLACLSVIILFSQIIHLTLINAWLPHWC